MLHRFVPACAKPSEALPGLSWEDMQKPYPASLPGISLQSPYPDTCYRLGCKGRMDQWADGNIQWLMGRGPLGAPAVSDLINQPKGCLTGGACRWRLEWKGSQAIWP